MEINLSEEMIEKICRVSFGRMQDLKEKEKITRDSIAVGQANIRRKHIHLKDIETAMEEANKVHELFFELLKQIDPDINNYDTNKDVSGF